MAIFSPTHGWTACPIASGSMALTYDGSTSTKLTLQEPEGTTCLMLWGWDTPQDLAKFEMYCYGWADTNQTHIHQVFKKTTPWQVGSEWSGMVSVHSIETACPSDTWADILRGNACLDCYGIGIVVWINEDIFYNPEVKEVRGQTINPRIACDTCSPTTYEYGTVYVGESDCQNWVVRNPQGGGVNAEVDFTKGGTNPDQFIHTGYSHVSIPPGGTWPPTGHINFCFEPTSAGSKSAWWKVNCTNCESGYTTITQNVHGTGATVNPPRACCDACSGTAYNFGSVQIGGSAYHEWTIRNCGVSPCLDTQFTNEITGTNASEFHITGSIYNIPCGGSDNIEVQFRPETAGTKTATLHIRCTNCQSGYTDIYQPLTGTSVGSPYAEITDMHASQTSYTHPGPNGANPTIYMTIKNVGTGSGQFIAHIDGPGETWESDPFTLGVGASSQKSHQFTGVYGWTFTGIAFAYRNGDWWEDDFASCAVTVNYTWCDLDFGASYGHPGPFQRGETVLFAEPVLVNQGNYAGTAYTRYYYKDPASGWVSPTGWLKTDAFTGGHDSEITPDHNLTIPMTIPLGVLQVGLICWGQDEPEPGSEILDYGGGQHKTWNAEFVEAGDDWSCEDIVDFGELPVGATNQTYMLINNYVPGSTIHLTQTNSDPVNFIVSPDSEDCVYGGGGECGFGIGFMPQSEGLHEATLTITCTNGYTPATKNVIIRGTGIAGVSCSAAFQESGIVLPGTTIHADFTWTNAYNVYQGADATMHILKPDGTTICSTYQAWDEPTGQHTLECVTDVEGTYTAFITVANGYNEEVQCEASLEVTTTPMAIGDIDIEASTWYTEFAPGQQNVSIADIKLMNTGTADGLIKTKYFYRVSHPGAPDTWTPLNSNPFQQQIVAGGSAIANHKVNIPTGIQTGATVFGVKVWSEDETEPGVLYMLGGFVW